MTKKTRGIAKRSLLVFVCCATAITGCAVDPKTGQPSFKETFASDDPCSDNNRNIGIVAGTILGAVLGHQLDKKGGALIGAGMGALAGGLVGRDMDRKRCELSKLAKKYSLDMTIAEVKTDGSLSNASTKNPDVTGLSVSIRDQDSAAQFEVGSDQLTPNAQVYFSEIANEYSYPKQLALLPRNASPEARQTVELLKNKRLLIVGHTDDSGSSQFNADLSERRARALAAIFEKAGISPRNLFFQGAGETLPIADNRTSEGRAANRRVEIIDLTDEKAFRQYLATRTARTDYYRVERGKSPKSTNIANSNEHAIPMKVESGVTAKSRPQRAAAESEALVGTNKAGTSPRFDFGGMPSGTKVSMLDIGSLAPSAGFNLISSAQADDSPLAHSCEYDKPRIANGVKSFKDNKEIVTADYMPGLYGTSWTDSVNGNLVALTRVAVLRDGGAPAGRPRLLIYKGYKPGSNVKPDYSVSPEVNAYKGQKALLYRVFVGGPINCLDIVIPNADPSISKGSWLYYDANGRPLKASFNPKKIKS